MKKLFPLVLILALLLTGCKVKEYTPEITDFSQRASVNSGDFSYECEISRMNGVVSVTAESTKAKGLSITYDGSKYTYEYMDMIYDISAIEPTVLNPAKIVYEVFEAVTSSDSVKVSKTSDGFRYDGHTSLGDFTLLQYDDYTYKSIYIKDAGIDIVFY